MRLYTILCGKLCVSWTLRSWGLRRSSPVPVLRDLGPTSVDVRREGLWHRDGDLRPTDDSVVGLRFQFHSSRPSELPSFSSSSPETVLRDLRTVFPGRYGSTVTEEPSSHSHGVPNLLGHRVCPSFPRPSVDTLLTTTTVDRRPFE